MRELGFAGLCVALLVGCASPQRAEETAAGPAVTDIASTSVVTTVATTVSTTDATTTVPASSQPPATAPATTATTTAAGRVAGGLCDPAPADAAGVTTGPEWRVGDIRQFEVESGRSGVDVGAGALAVTPVELEVLSTGPGETQLVWRSDLTDVVVAGADPATAEMVEDMAAELPAADIVYSIDRDHRFLGIENTAELREAMLVAFDLLVERGVMPEGDALAATRSLFVNLPDAQLGQLLSEDIQVLHLFDGVQLAAGERVEFDDRLPNAFGGDPFPALTVVELTRMVDEDGCVEIVQTTTPDPARFAEILTDSLARSELSPGDGGVDLTDLDFDIENGIVAQYDHATGRLRQVRATQRITVDGSTRTDTLIIRDVTPG